MLDEIGSVGKQMGEKSVRVGNGLRTQEELAIGPGVAGEGILDD